MRILPVITVLLISSLSHAVDYQVFTTTFLPAVRTGNYAAEIYYLNLPELTLARLGHHQQSGAKNAQQQALSLLGSEEGKAILEELAFAFKGVVSAWSHDISHLPAILVDDHYLFYGVYDLAEVESLVNAFRHKKLLKKEGKGQP